MNTPKHTPGPLTRDGTNIMGVRRDVGYKTCIANCGSFQSNTQNITIENEANAELFAAAPELAECLKAYVEWHKWLAFSPNPTFIKATALLERIGY